ncbi:hypothetical protein X798_03389 [Onchocerca flexuosa]|uniref:RING-type domain-containing protein n=1 Tax=Onchocerca flexuosa TaxID=387005 RepID=A0A238BY57_9BILA|nr:hypothetical protein X798_03389 [Onchocerca flexuosa]
MAVCSICFECKQPNDMQKLPCSHIFCKDCISKCSVSQLCPTPCCTHVRHVNVVIDEADENDEETQKISFGQKLPSMLQLEERQRCDGRKGAFACVNSARMTLMDCRHRLCFDCLSSRINVAVAAQELPYCPIFRCANRLTKNEIAKISERMPHMRQICAKLIEACPEDAPEEPPIILDMVSAMIQVQRLKKNSTATNIGVYIRTTVAGKPKYDPIDVKAMTKKKISDTDFHDRSHFVLDVDNELKIANSANKK